MSLLGAILAGGGSRRFGSPKTLARLHGTPLWKVAAGRLREVCDDVVAIVNHPGVARAVELETLPDRLRLMGPLGGIDAALDRGWRDGYAAVMVLAVDGRDFPLLQGVTLVLALAVVLANILVDMSYGFIDPRVKAQ